MTAHGGAIDDRRVAQDDAEKLVCLARRHSRTL